MIQELSRILDRKTAPRRARFAGRLLFAGIGLASIILGGWAVMRSDGRDVEPEPEPTFEPAPNEAQIAAEAPREPLPAPSPRESRAGLSVPSFGVGAGVVEHELVGRSDRFPGGSAVCFWTRVVGAESGETLQHVWQRDGQTVMVRKLRIGSANWRTYSRYKLPPDAAGSWVVEARTADGRILAREEFITVPVTE
jgi:hypothetical protein